MTTPRLSIQGLRVLSVLMRSHLANPRAELTGMDIVDETNWHTGRVYAVLRQYVRAGILVSRIERNPFGQQHGRGRPRGARYRLTPYGAQYVRDTIADIVGVMLPAGNSASPRRGQRKIAPESDQTRRRRGWQSRS